MDKELGMMIEAAALLTAVTAACVFTVLGKRKAQWFCALATLGIATASFFREGVQWVAVFILWALFVSLQFVPSTEKKTPKEQRWWPLWAALIPTVLWVAQGARFHQSLMVQSPREWASGLPLGLILVCGILLLLLAAGVVGYVARPEDERA